MHEIFEFLWTVPLFLALIYKMIFVRYSKILSSVHNIDISKNLFKPASFKRLSAIRETSKSKEVRSLSEKLLNAKTWMWAHLILTTILFALQFFFDSW